MFEKYDVFSLARLENNKIEEIIKPVGTFRKKAGFIKEICQRLVADYNGKVPNSRKYLESLPGVGRKTCNVVLSHLFNEPAIAVDTHVERVSKRLKLASSKASVLEVEKKLMKAFPENEWSRIHLQLVLFGRYYCKAIKPMCSNCKLKDLCKEKRKN